MKPGKEMPFDEEFFPGGVKLTLGVSRAPSPPAVPDATGFSESDDRPRKSWVIWLKDGRYSYAWGETKEAALDSWLKQFERGVQIIVPAGDINSPAHLSPALYLREMNG